MAHGNPGSMPPVSFAGALLVRYRHVCAFINSREEAHEVFDPFVLEGLANGERLSFIVGPAERSGLVRHYRQLGLDVPRLIEQGDFEVRTWAETHLRHGRFDADAMLALSEATMRASQLSRIRMVSDMGWAAAQEDPAALIAYEARANPLIERYPHVVICVYDAARFGGDVMIDVLRTHPLVLIGGMLQENPFFVPPEQLLGELEDRRRAPDG